MGSYHPEQDEKLLFILLSCHKIMEFLRDIAGSQNLPGLHNLTLDLIKAAFALSIRGICLHQEGINLGGDILEQKLGTGTRYIYGHAVDID